MESSGAAEFLASWLVNACSGGGNLAVLAAVYVLTVLLSELLSNGATAALMGGLALAAAAKLNVDARPFLMAIAIAASCAFATPIGYQTNLMVLNPGGYRFRDYMRVGLPLNFICAAIALLIIPFVWPFRPPQPRALPVKAKVSEIRPANNRSPAPAIILPAR